MVFLCQSNIIIFFQMNNELSAHQLRLSLDLRSIKEHQFTAQLSFRYKAIQSIGLSSFRSASIPIVNPKVQFQLKDCFSSGTFTAEKTNLTEKITQKIEIQLWHVDRLRNDILLGKAIFQLEKLSNMPLRTAPEVYSRVLDSYWPIDQYDQAGKPVKTIGKLRIIAYLEDFGPVGKLKERGFDIKQFLQEAAQQNNMPSRQNMQQQPQRAAIQNSGLNQLERKVVWELQTWKKAEQAKTRLTLKQKEIEFWTNLSQQQRKSDLQKQKQIKQIFASLTIEEGKIKHKLSDLIKRQQKIIVYEQELQTKISEVSRQCLVKDQQMQSLKRKHKEDKTSVIKEKAQVQIQLAKMRAQNAKLKVEMEQIRKTDQKSPINILKAEINSKIFEIKELSRELQKANEVKEQYKIYYGKMKEEVISLRQKLKMYEESFHELRRQKQIIANNYKHIQQQLAYERQIYQQQMQKGYHRQEYGDQYEEMGGNDRSRLMRQREQLIKEGNYTPKDPLIVELDKQIKSLS